MKQLVTLSIYSLLIISFSSCEQEEAVQPSIKYVDLNDNKASQSQSFSLDIDGDGDTDFLFTTLLTAGESGDQRQFVIAPARANQVFEIAGRVGVLEVGQEIAPGNPFDKNVQPMVIKRIANTGTSWSGDWREVSNKFIGIRFVLRDQMYYYGWIRVSFDQTNEQLIIHDYAYRTALNLSIKAGAK
jgi:hypothetical protein